MKNKKLNIIILVLFFAIAGSIIILKSLNSKTTGSTVTESSVKTETKLPKLLDLGSDRCVPCKMMMPILDTLRNVHAGKLDIEFIDVWQDRETGSQYGIRTIPTQIIFDASGIELYRHEGFWSREDIESKLKELGISLTDNS